LPTIFSSASSASRERRKTTFRSLTEQGLRIVLKEKQAKPAKWKWKPVTFKGGGFDR
jgi:glycine cleavage system regulatory protein